MRATEHLKDIAVAGRMRFLDLVLVAILMIGATLWIAVAMSAEPPQDANASVGMGSAPALHGAPPTQVRPH